MNLELKKAITEVLDILDHMDKLYREKIPIRFRKFLEKNKLNMYIPQLDHSKRLEEMQLNSNAKNILGIIYFKYWCDKTQREEFMKRIKLNEILY